MKNRYIPFGYQIKNGELSTLPTEAEIVREIFRHYAAGETLKSIAEALTAQRIKYLPEKYTWDKARVKRVLDNTIYLGEKGYPSIISADLFKLVQQRKNKTGPKPIEIDSVTKIIKSAAVCKECGHSLTRRTDNRFSPPTAWKCPCCSLSIRMSDKGLKAKILVILNRLIASPSLAQTNESDTPIDSLEARRSEQELHRMMDAGTFSEDDTLSLVLRCAAKTYESITSARHISDRLTAALRHAKPLSSLDERLFLQTVENILIGRSGAISLKLQNGKIISEEGDNGVRTAASPNSDCDPCHKTAGTESSWGQESPSSCLLPGILQKGRAGTQL